jgi:co-chaperonin GroES (HSP10)
MLTDQTSDTQTLSSTTGILVAVGDQAFVWDSDRATRWEGDKPKAGARVCFQRYSGQEYFGLDGQLYRVLQDRSIGGAMGMAAIEEASDAGADLFETAAA